MKNNIQFGLKKYATVAVLAAAVAVCRQSSAAFDPAADLKSPESLYIAPTSLISYRMRHADGLFRELDRGEDAVSQIVGARGWHGAVRGRKITVWSGRDVKDGPAEYRFTDGRLSSLEFKDAKRTVPRCGLPVRDEPIEALWPDAQEGHRNERIFFDVWRNMGRLRMFFTNPNQTALLFAELAMIALAFVFGRRPAVRWGAGAAAAVLFFLTIQTGSRSGVLAFLAGGGCLALPRLISCGTWRKHVKKALIVLVIALAVGLALLATGSRRMTRDLLDTGSSRVEILRAVPQMMCDAPDGWGWYAGGYMTGPGKAYHDWYQPIKRFSMTLTLVSDHLTQLVRFGWFGRFAYLFAWFALLAVLIWAAVRRSTPLPLSVWMTFLICTGANRVSEEWTLWIVPVAVTAVAMPAVLRTMGVRRVAASLVVAAVMSTAVLGAAFCAAEDSDGIRVRTQDNRVYVKSMHNPDRWLVDDGTVFGGGFFAKEMRLFYRANPSAPGLGYVRNVFDLPDNVHKLVLGGRAGWEFLTALNDGTLRPTFRMPKKILFVSPPFPPRAIPELMLKNVEVRFVVGEFATAYFDDYRTERDWVQVVQGAELYIPNWMHLVTGF